MAYTIQSGKQDPTLEYFVTDAATGAQMRVTVLGGAVGLMPEQKAFRVTVAGRTEPGESVGFYVPGMNPLADGPDPVILPEVYLSQVGVFDGTSNMTRMLGVGDLATQIVNDEQNPGNRWIYLSFNCFGGSPMVARYRVTVYRAA